MNDEVWVQIKDFAGYEVSNLGNIRSDKLGFSKILKPKLVRGGYLTVCLYKTGVPYVQWIHHIVADNFICGKKKINTDVIDHINRDRLDNRASNLRIISRSENSLNINRGSLTSKYPGIYWHEFSSKWTVRKHYKGVRLFIGQCITEADAIELSNNTSNKILQEKFEKHVLRKDRREVIT